MKQLFLKIGVFVCIVAVGVVILNAPYFLKQFSYIFGTTEAPLPAINQDNPSVELGEPNQIKIPSLNIIAPLQYVTEINEDVFQQALQSGVVHYPGTAEIGQPGNAYFFGHSSDFVFAKGDYKTVFALLPRIKNGAEILVTDKEGKVYHYEVIDQRAVDNDDVEVLDQKEFKQKLLTLQTSYPVGTALRRYIVVGRLKD